ncbi:MAG TPA: 2-phosphosulfolactate phosphatase [Actinomycetota bacterium]|nr:2-phosphosulfolactate phosphatase [Actinomycetota bacterium]
MRGRVLVDCFPAAVPRYGPPWTIVAVDVIRATTTIVTALSQGRRCFPVATLDEALEVMARLDDPLVAGELGGSTPYGFEMTNSPAHLARRTDVGRPLVLLSTSGTQLICGAHPDQPVYAASLRNLAATVGHVAQQGGDVAIIGAGARGSFRREDQLGCAWIARGLAAAGYRPQGGTEELIRRYRDAPVDVIATGASARYLEETGQRGDLEFILEHVDDVDGVFCRSGEEMVDARRPPSRALSADDRREEG